ncbi:MAG: hypothetical protein IPP53_14200 [Bacteroidetes bacterium]|nr:hypothetical protein [Bacteroidota bacterium]
MKKILLFAFTLISIFKVNAQSQCGTDEFDAFLKRTNPTYAAERQKMEEQIYSILKISRIILMHVLEQMIASRAVCLQFL